MQTYFTKLARRLARLCAAFALAASACVALAELATRDPGTAPIRRSSTGWIASSVISGSPARSSRAGWRSRSSTFRSADAPRLAMLNGHEMVYAASLPKIAILLGAFVEAERGRIPLDDAHLGEITRMIRFSSNEAATRVLDWVGHDRLLAILQSPAIALYDPKRWRPLGRQELQPRGRLPARSDQPPLSRGHRFPGRALLLAARQRSPRRARPSRPDEAGALAPRIHHKFVKGLESRPGVEIYRKSGTWRTITPTARWWSEGATSS